MGLTLTKINPGNITRGLRGVADMMSANNSNLASIESAALGAITGNPVATFGEIILGKTIYSALFGSLTDEFKAMAKRTFEFLAMLKGIKMLSASS